jgi:hypothetical protein
MRNGDQRAVWEGSQLCRGTTRGKQRCTDFEIDGLEHCLHHVPDEMLDEAEEITGMRRCRTRFGQPDACRQYAVAGTVPPACTNHGANIGSVTSIEAEKRKINEAAAQHLGEIMAADPGNWLEGAQPVEDPLTELLELAGRIKLMETRLSEMVAKLDLSKWRYTRDRMGEQIRAEIILLERAQERFAQILVQIAKLNITERLAKIEQRKLDTLERAMTMAFQAAKVTPEGREEGLKVLRRELKAVA